MRWPLQVQRADIKHEDSLVVKTALSVQGVQVGSLVRELASHMPHNVAKK